MPNNLPSDSENERTGQGRLFGRERPIHEVLGGGKGTIIYFSLICPLSKPSIQQITCKWNQCQQYRSTNGSNMFPHVDFERFSMRKKNLFGAINFVLLLINKDFFGLAVADVLLWRKRNISASLLVGMTVMWFLFEVVEYNFVTLLCHISITTMLVFFIWCTGAEIFKW